MDTIAFVAATALAVFAVGALAGTAGFAALIVRRQNRHVAQMAERLATAGDGSAAVAEGSGKIEDPRLRGAFVLLADRVAETWQRATIDPLTCIASRQALLSRLDDELARAARYRRQLAVVMVDLDHFKRLNDTHGHAAGDAVLREVAQRLADGIRSVDFVGRFGGEEFLLVLPETDADAAATLAEKLRRAVAGSPVVLPDGQAVSVTLSAGVAGGPGDVLRPDTLIRDADAALYSAKALGRNTVYVFRETDDGDTVRRSPIRIESRTAAIEVGRAAMRAAQRELLRALDGLPPHAGRPSELIAEASLALARAIELPEEELDGLRTASLLHDLGQLAVPDEILNKPADLDASEWRTVAEHPKIGQVVLEQAGALRDAAMIVLHHHEWFDGRGYPYGLAGIDIPVGARIVAICDAYEAMVAGRPYRDAVSHADAIAELRRMAGTQFDPELVEVFAEQFPSGVPWAPSVREPAPISAARPRSRDRGKPGAPATADAHDGLPRAGRRAG